MSWILQNLHIVGGFLIGSGVYHAFKSRLLLALVLCAVGIALIMSASS